MSVHAANRAVKTRPTTTILLLLTFFAGCDRMADTVTGPSAPTAMLETAIEEADEVRPPPIEDGSTAPTSLGVDVAQLLPLAVELATPVVCGSITVFEEEDLATLCSATTLAATPIISPTCPQTVSGSVRLETDLFCNDSDGLIVGADNTVIDLNGHKIVCRSAAGYFGSCQGPVLADNDEGIDTNNRDNVHIFSSAPGGTIDGFDRGVAIRRESDNIKVKQLTITGPAGATGVRRPRFTSGVRIDGVDCDGGNVKIGAGRKTGNDISHHNRGIDVTNASCVFIGYNVIHTNKKNVFGALAGEAALGIALLDSPDNHIRSNVLSDNGDGGLREGGIALYSMLGLGTNNLVVENESNRNMGNGIEILQRAADNYVVNNQMLGNTGFDAYSEAINVNRWNENNQCRTQSAPQPPPGVCGPDE